MSAEIVQLRQMHEMEMDGDLVEHVFGEGGLLSKHLDGYKPRPGQMEMARAVASAIEDEDHLIAEGPTGTGKSVAYLVPAIYHAKTHGKCVVVATGNIALQEQLVTKDLPLLQKVFPFPFEFTIFKGRGNYLCEDKLAKLYREESQTDMFKSAGREVPAFAKGSELAQIVDWAQTTETGDKSELQFVPHHTLWSRFSTGADDCKGRRCRSYDDCHAYKARANAAQCQVIVVNYHVLFANLKFQGAVLPPFDIAILDEAHEAADIARDFLGFKITEGTFKRLAHKLDGYRYAAAAGTVKRAGEKLFSALRSYARSDRYNVRLRRANVVRWDYAEEALEEAVELLRQTKAVATSPHATAEIEIEEGRALTALNSLKSAMGLEDKNHVCFLNFDSRSEDRLSLEGKPISVAGLLRVGFFDPTPTVVLTSATLSVHGEFDHALDDIGLVEPRELIVESPFNEEQALFIVPTSGPLPNKYDEFIEYIQREIVNVIEMAGGRTLCLFTSYRALDRVHEYVEKNVRGLTILRQGDAPRTKLVEEFKEDETSVLMGTRSFWAGVDVPGRSLSAVIIDKLPFPSPADPILDAMQDRYGRQAFFKVSVPRAIITFKQGVGRLIRRTTDRGVVVCFDKRLVTKGYGRGFVKSLPAMLQSRDLYDVADFLGFEDECRCTCRNRGNDRNCPVGARVGNHPVGSMVDDFDCLIGADGKDVDRDLPSQTADEVPPDFDEVPF